MNPTQKFWRRNSARNSWEFHGGLSSQGQPKCIEGTQEIPRQQKWRIWEDTKISKWIHRCPKSIPKWKRTPYRNEWIRDKNWQY
jgi:hypothetical protein